MKFYLGTDSASWLWRGLPGDWPLFVSTRRLERYRNFHPSQVTWALDSGGFTELNLFGRWETTPHEYVRRVRRYVTEIGSLDWAAPQDWMCEPFVLAKTGLDVAEHQARTIANYLELRSLDAALPFVPVLQGWTHNDYLRHRDAYAAAGVDLAAEPRVGIGSVCRRAHFDEAAAVIARLSEDGIALHGFGIKADGIRRYGSLLASADSLAWSFAARRRKRNLCGLEHRARYCHHCSAWASRWAREATAVIGEDDVQMRLV